MNEENQKEFNEHWDYSKSKFPNLTKDPSVELVAQLFYVNGRLDGSRDMNGKLEILTNPQL